SSILSAPKILVNNGNILVGSNNSSKANTSVIRGNKIYIEQDAEKGLQNDSALIIYSSGKVEISSSATTHGNIYLGSNNAMTIALGGALIFADSSYLSYPNDASVIDYGNNNIPAVESYPFNSFDTLLLSLPFSSVLASEIDNEFKLFSWSENSHTFNLIDGSSSINGGSGNLFVTKPSPSVQQFSGTLNTGDIDVSLSKSNNGLNLIGNPYPSAIDFDRINLSENIQSSIYIFNPISNNYEIIQQNGLNMYSENAIIDQNQAFFVFTDNNSTFNFTSSCQTHNLDPVIKDVSSLNHISMTFSTGGKFIDAVGLIFGSSASENYQNKEDAIELENVQNLRYINSYTYSADNKKLAINSKLIPADESTISIFMISDMEGFYEFHLDKKTLSAGVEVFLIDPASNDTTDLQTNQYYYFDYNNANVEKEFLLLFKGNMVNADEDFANTNIYSFNKNVYVNTSSQINKVEIYTITGVKIISENVNSNTAIIKTNLENGVYIVKAYLSDEIKTQKIIIN
ncbi:MAG: T9SS type A sorting domain-containing protein, partial [Bacteroidota bacterium]|nr:T9SS type A sorting domain-containing protein [Bacteroidota bacterium]